MKMKKQLFLLMITLSMGVIACEKDKNSCKEKQVYAAWTEEYNPVCGCNNKTYDNPSHAEAYSITDYTMGKCTSE